MGPKAAAKAEGWSAAGAAGVAGAAGAAGGESVWAACVTDAEGEAAEVLAPSCFFKMDISPWMWSISSCNSCKRLETSPGEAVAAAGEAAGAASDVAAGDASLFPSSARSDE